MLAYRVCGSARAARRSAPRSACKYRQPVRRVPLNAVRPDRRDRPKTWLEWTRGFGLRGLGLRGLRFLFGFAFLLLAFFDQLLVADHLADHLLGAALCFFPERAHDGPPLCQGKTKETPD